MVADKIIAHEINEPVKSHVVIKSQIEIFFDACN